MPTRLSSSPFDDVFYLFPSLKTIKNETEKANRVHDVFTRDPRFLSTTTDLKNLLKLKPHVTTNALRQLIAFVSKEENVPFPADTHLANRKALLQLVWLTKNRPHVPNENWDTYCAIMYQRMDNNNKYVGDREEFINERNAMSTVDNYHSNIDDYEETLLAQAPDQNAVIDSEESRLSTQLCKSYPNKNFGMESTSESDGDPSNGLLNSFFTSNSHRN